jgi:hypothetical protein
LAWPAPAVVAAAQLLQQNISPLRSTLVDGSTIGMWQWAHVPMAAWLV